MSKKHSSSAHNKRSVGRLIKLFLPYYKPYGKTLFFDLFCALLTTGCELALPMIARKITGTAESNPAELTTALILTVGIAYFAMRAIDALAYYFMADVGHVMGCKIETDMRHDLFAHLQKLSFSYYDNTKIGTLMSRITSDLFEVTEFAHHCPEEFLIAGIKIIGSFIILCTINLPMALISFLLIPIMIFILFNFNIKRRNVFRESKQQIGEINAQVEDSLLGTREVKSFSNESIEETKFDAGNVTYLSIKRRQYKYMGLFHSLSRFFEGLLYIIVVVAGAFFLKGVTIFGITFRLTVSDYIAFLLYVSMLFAAIRRIVEFAEQFQIGMTGIERFQDIMEIEPEIRDRKNAIRLENCKGEIKLEKIVFKYETKASKVFDGFSMNVKPGENLAIVGPSGGGKTTLCSLIPRFYELQGGSISIDGHDIKDYTITSLRRNIGIVQQNVYMFSGSIRDNIAYGKPGATDEEIINAAKLAGADEFIMSLPNGYGTYVGERGVKLSGGQKQRISIARVFLKNPPILILDEATSALDNDSERLVQSSLERLAKGRTTITIAHRLTTIRNADRILVVDQGQIIEEGSHTELMQKNGAYASLYRLYTAD